MSSISAVKGARDFYPQEMAFRQWLYQKIRNVSQAFGYQEYDGPFLERQELYAGKLGEELIKEQSFVFPDRSGELIALRPELTHSLARMVAARSKTLIRPIRWWSFGPFWRYERPQKGRAREFYQWNIDLLGIDSPQADAEMAAVAAEFFRSIALPPESVALLINNRKLVDDQLQAIGLPPEKRSEVFRLIDRRDKLSATVWEEDAIHLGLTKAQLASLRSILQDTNAWERCEDLVLFFDAAVALGVRSYLRYDPTVIRGLDYYTGTVYEARDSGGTYRAILGGGRYDNLVADVGGDPIPGTGFAMGDVVLGLMLQAYDVLPVLRPSPTDVLVLTFALETQLESVSLARDLRTAGLQSEWYPEVARLPKQLKYAERQGIPVIAILGPDEIREGSVTLKHLDSRTQQTVQRADAASAILALLGRS